MAKILDLSAYREETADITFDDGQVLHLKKPTELVVIRLLQMREVNEQSDPMLILATLNAIAREILNLNEDGLSFTMERVAEMPTDVKARIVQAYSQWATELQSNPTASSPRSPEKPAEKRRSLREWFMRSRNTRG